MSVAARPLLLLALMTGAALPARAGGTYVVASDQPAFAMAARAAVDALPGAKLLRADDEAKAAIAGAELVIVVGPLAERLVGAALPATAWAVAVLTPRLSSLPAARSLAVPVAASATEVLGLMRVVVPSTRKVAVFPAGSSDVAALADAVRASGLEPLLPKAGEPFPAAVDRLVRAADVVWIEETSSVPAGGGALVVKAAADAGKHVVGPNRATVLQGALFAVVPDPAAHGRLAGELGARVLAGDRPSSVPAPEGRIVLNAARARALGVKLPQSVAARAEAVE
ncbi:MAG: hypothetical protein HYS27_25180 [Deltaproteobacteria bacterium]|nr:hypothetical protein [Deltaproteobacteria bacterium]